MKAHTAARSRVAKLVEMIATGIALLGLLIAAALPAVSQTSQAEAAKAAGGQVHGGARDVSVFSGLELPRVHPGA